MVNWFKKNRAKTTDIEKMFGFPPGIFLFVKNKYHKEFVEEINNSQHKKIYTERVFPSSFEEVSKYSELDKCDFSKEKFKEGEEITKYWIVSK
jgi:hypothetical protein